MEADVCLLLELFADFDRNFLHHHGIFANQPVRLFLLPLQGLILENVQEDWRLANSSKYSLMFRHLPVLFPLQKLLAVELPLPNDQLRVGCDVREPGLRILSERPRDRPHDGDQLLRLQISLPNSKIKVALKR